MKNLSLLSKRVSAALIAVQLLAVIPLLTRYELPVVAAQSAPQQCRGAVRMAVVIETVKNLGQGNAGNRIYLANGQNVASGEFFDLITANGQGVIDPPANRDVPGISVERGNGFVRLGLYGRHPAKFPANLEAILGRVVLQNGRITGVQNNEPGVGNRFEGQGNGTYDFTDVRPDDEFFLDGRFYTSVDIATDFITLPYADEFAGTSCPQPQKPECSDGIDNADPEDTLADFNDPGCYQNGVYNPNDPSETDDQQKPECSDGRDNADPEDTLSDFNDPGCYTNGVYNPNDPSETNEEQRPECSDGRDNADPEDTLVDYNDPGCYTNGVYNPNDNDERNQQNNPQCSDGIDNDYDGKIDFPSDPGCDNPQDDDEKDNTPQFGCIEIVKETFDTRGNPLPIAAQFTFKLDGHRTTVNLSNGRARFDSVPAGSHRVEEIVPSSWQQVSVTPSGGQVHVSPGSYCAGVIFKNQQVLSSYNAAPYYSTPSHTWGSTQTPSSTPSQQQSNNAGWGTTSVSPSSSGNVTSGGGWR